MIVTAYGDESGTHDGPDGSPIMMLAGYVSTSEQWDYFRSALEGGGTECETSGILSCYGTLEYRRRAAICASRGAAFGAVCQVWVRCGIKQGEL